MSALPSHVYEANDEWGGVESFADHLPGWEGLDPLSEDDPDQGGCIRCAPPELCDACQEPVDPDTAHDLPAPNGVYWFHPDCCPECNEDEE